MQTVAKQISAMTISYRHQVQILKVSKTTKVFLLKVIF